MLMAACPERAAEKLGSVVTLDVRPDICKHGATTATYIAVLDRNLRVWAHTRDGFRPS